MWIKATVGYQFVFTKIAAKAYTYKMMLNAG